MVGIKRTFKGNFSASGIVIREDISKRQINILANGFVFAKAENITSARYFVDLLRGFLEGWATSEIVKGLQPLSPSKKPGETHQDRILIALIDLLYFCEAYPKEYSSRKEEVVETIQGWADNNECFVSGGIINLYCSEYKDLGMAFPRFKQPY